MTSSGTNTKATHETKIVVDPALPVGIGLLELLDIPGRWGRIDAFGRGRVHT